MRDVVRGMLAGAAGTAALNMSAYLDMAIRGRGPSELSDKMARKLAELASFPAFAKPQSELTDRERHQRTGIGALLGYADGLAVGALFGMMRPLARGVPWFWAGIVLGVTTMVVSEGTATALGQTNPKEWPASSWVADVIPRCLYGWVTCVTFDQFTSR